MIFLVTITVTDKQFYLASVKGNYLLTPDIMEAVRYPSQYAAKQAARHLPHKVTRGGFVGIQKMPQKPN